MNKAQRKVAIIFCLNGFVVDRDYLGALSAHIRWSDTGVSRHCSLVSQGNRVKTFWIRRASKLLEHLDSFGGGLALAGATTELLVRGLQVGMKSFNIPILFWVIIWHF